MILRKGQLPSAVRGFRILVLPAPPVQESDIIITPEAHQYRPNKGTLLAAGMNALDQMHDHGDQIGDEVWWGKFAGVIEEWDHLDAEAPKAASCEHVWVGQPSPGPKSRKWKCVECGSTRIAEHVLVMNVDDLLANVSLQRRIENGEVSIARGKRGDGATQHFLDRKDR